MRRGEGGRRVLAVVIAAQRHDAAEISHHPLSPVARETIELPVCGENPAPHRVSAGNLFDVRALREVLQDPPAQIVVVIADNGAIAGDLAVEPCAP